MNLKMILFVFVSFSTIAACKKGDKGSQPEASGNDTTTVSQADSSQWSLTRRYTHKMSGTRNYNVTINMRVTHPAFDSTSYVDSIMTITVIDDTTISVLGKTMTYRPYGSAADTSVALSFIFLFGHHTWWCHYYYREDYIRLICVEQHHNYSNVYAWLSRQ